MGDTVFANSRSIACKASGGKAAAAFPDVCLTPPPPPTGPLPVPYPNTVLASDLKDGSKRVLIAGKPVFLEDRSIFGTSSGDEAGTQGGGVVTHKTKGTAQFVSWSDDVLFEGKGVPRHLDMTIHNGASVPDNTQPWPYLYSNEQGDVGPCKGAPEDPCRLVPWDSKKCPPDKHGVPRTPHHLIPAHCFYAVGSRAAKVAGRKIYHKLKYHDRKAPCICVTGATKSPGTGHRKMHDIFDTMEDARMSGGKAGIWKYKDARKAALRSVKVTFPECPEECIKRQLDNYHQQAGCDDETQLRADSTGKHGEVNLPT